MCFLSERLISLPSFDAVAFHASAGLSGSAANASDIQRVPLTSYYSRLYTGPVLIGSPPQQQQLVFDTGSADLWTFSSRTQRKLPFLHYFDGAASSTYQPLNIAWSIRYGKGEVSGLLCEDSVSVANMTARDFRFAEAVSYSTDLVDRELPLDGIAGMAFSEISRAKVRRGSNNSRHRAAAVGGELRG